MKNLFGQIKGSALNFALSSNTMRKNFPQLWLAHHVQKVLDLSYTPGTISFDNRSKSIKVTFENGLDVNVWCDPLEEGLIVAFPDEPTVENGKLKAKHYTNRHVSLYPERLKSLSQQFSYLSLMPICERPAILLG